MIDRFMVDNNQYVAGDEKMAEMDKTKNYEEFLEAQFQFNTLFNDIQKNNNQEQKIYEIDKFYNLKNQYISLNFEKREINEITSYGWYNSDTNDDKKFEELIYRLKSKGQDKIGFDINVSPPPPNNTTEQFQYIFICKFIIGEGYILFQNDELEKTKEELSEKYDTIVKLSDKTKKYEVLKPENIQLLYLIKVKTVDYSPKIIPCTGFNGNNCKMLENGQDGTQPQDQKKCYCLLNDSYLCKLCHDLYHRSQIVFGEFGPENCEQKPLLNNYQGDCENPIHQKKEIIEFFCKDCNKGLCSYCRFNSNEHKDLYLITNLFTACPLNDKKNISYKKIKDGIDDIKKNIYNRIAKIRASNYNTANYLRATILEGFKKMFKESNDSFTHEGELLLGMCYQLNYLKDCIHNFNKLYEERENLLKGTKLKQELYWTKRIHYDNLLYLINVKETIKTGYKVDLKNFDKIISKYKKKFKYPISIFQMMDDFGYKETSSIKQNMNITVKNLVDETGINYGKMMKKQQK